MNPANHDLRAWIGEVESINQLHRIQGVPWDKDMGGLVEMILERSKHSPALLFEKMPNAREDMQILCSQIDGIERLALAMGNDPKLGVTDFIQAWRRKVRNFEPMEPEYVKDGPIFENVLTGDAVDISKFPTPIWHVNDGGRYIGTGCYSVTMDPDERWINIGCYRAMIQDQRSVSLLIVPGKHGYMHREKYFRRGEKMPLVIVVGGDPLFFFMAGTEHPYGLCEYDIVGGMRRKPVELVRGKITGLPFPASAEIVLEGFLSNDNRKNEGPFGEWTGYYASDESAQPVLEIQTVYHRNDPIILGVPPLGGGSDEMARYRAIMRSAMLKQELANAGVPDVAQVWCHEVGASRMLHGIAIKQRYPGHAKQVGVLSASCGSTVYGCKMVVVVDDDIDVSNFEQLMWAMATRCDPATSIDILRRMRTSPADPRLTPEQRKARDLTNSRMVVDATRPYDWMDKFPRVNAPSQESARKGREKFGYLLK